VARGTTIFFLKTDFISEYSCNAPALIKVGNSKFLGVRLIGISVDKLITNHSHKEEKQKIKSSPEEQPEFLSHEWWENPTIPSFGS
jgi:hypothetical protein